MYCAGLCWAIQGSTVLKPRNVFVKLFAQWLKQWLIACERSYRAGGSLEQPDDCWSLLQSRHLGLAYSSRIRPSVKKPSNYPTFLVYSPTVLDLNLLGCAGLYWALVVCIGLWWGVLGSGGLCWALRLHGAVLHYSLEMFM